MGRVRETSVIVCKAGGSLPLEFKRESNIDLSHWIQIPYGGQGRSGDSVRRKGFLSQLFGSGAKIGTLGVTGRNLYRATASPGDLMRYVDKTVSSIVTKNGKITAHAGFLPVNAVVFAPIIIFEAMSILTGQYYLNGISNQLSAIDKKINELIQLHHTERYAKINHSIKFLECLKNQRAINIENMVALLMVTRDLGVIHEEYARMLMDISVPKNFSSRWIKRKIQELSGAVDGSEFEFKLQMAIVSDDLLHLSKLIELYMNSRMSDNPQSRGERISELYNEIKNWTKDQFYFYSEGDEVSRKFHSYIIRSARDIYSDANFFTRNKAYGLLDGYKQLSEECKGEPKNKGTNELLEMSRKLVDAFEQPKQIAVNSHFNEVYVMAGQH